MGIRIPRVNVRRVSAAAHMGAALRKFMIHPCAEHGVRQLTADDRKGRPYGYITNSAAVNGGGVRAPRPTEVWYNSCRAGPVCPAAGGTARWILRIANQRAHRFAMTFLGCGVCRRRKGDLFFGVRVFFLQLLFQSSLLGQNEVRLVI